MKKIVNFRPMNDITKRVKLKPVVMFKQGELYSGIKQPNNRILAYTDRHHEPILIKSSSVYFE